MAEWKVRTNRRVVNMIRKTESLCVFCFPGDPSGSSAPLHRAVAPDPGDSVQQDHVSESIL